MDGCVCVIDHVKPKHFTFSIWGNYLDRGVCLEVSMSLRRAPKKAKQKTTHPNTNDNNTSDSLISLK
jgi:hypothetical protein